MKKAQVIILLSMFMFSSTILNGAYKKLAYDFSFKDLDGTNLNLSEFKNNVVVVTNVASKCGFTSQYEDLQIIWEKYQKDGLVVIGVPSNSFNQEPGSNQEVKNFCEAKFGISFPMTQKLKLKDKKCSSLFQMGKRQLWK